MMHCEEVKELLEVYLEGELDESEQSAVEAHISNCESCKQELALTRSIPRLVSSLSAPPAPEDIIPDTLRRLHDEKPGFLKRWMRVFGVPLSRKWQFVAVSLFLLAVSLFAR